MPQDLAVYLERCPVPGLAPDRIKDLMWQLLCGIDFLHRYIRLNMNLKLAHFHLFLFAQPPDCTSGHQAPKRASWSRQFPQVGRLWARQDLRL